MSTFLLILHSLVGVALLGAITHQVLALLPHRTVRTGSFVDRYTSVNRKVFTGAIVCFYIAQVALGAIIYPTYRLQVRIPFEEMSLGWAVGLFELKEHYAAIGLGLLPLYFAAWRTDSTDADLRDRSAVTFLIAFIVWWDFIIGHVLNNIRGFA